MQISLLIFFNKNYEIFLPLINFYLTFIKDEMKR
jgi:hypothetical protein